MAPAEWTRGRLIAVCTIGLLVEAVLVGTTARRSGLAPQPVILTTVIDKARGPAIVTTDTVNSPPALVGLVGTRMPPGDGLDDHGS